jgi:hypothetical protein
MKKLVIILFPVLTFAQSHPTTLYLGQDENNYPIYQNIRPFYSPSAKIAVGIFSGMVTGISTYMIVKRQKEKRYRRRYPLLQKNVTI